MFSLQVPPLKTLSQGSSDSDKVIVDPSSVSRVSHADLHDTAFLIASITHRILDGACEYRDFCCVVRDQSVSSGLPKEFLL